MPRALLVNADCFETLPRIPAESVDVILTDPPYFATAVHYSSRVEWGRSWTDAEMLGRWFSTLVPEFSRVLKPSGHLLVFCHHESYAAFYPYVFATFPKLVALVWDKGRAGLGRVWRHQHEFVIAARKKKPYEVRGRLFVDVLRHRAPLTRDRRHPAEKPVPLLRELLEATLPAGGTVLDPFMGSGSTGEAALSLGAQFIEVEKDPGYFDDTKNYLQARFPAAFTNAGRAAHPQEAPR